MSSKIAKLSSTNLDDILERLCDYYPKFITDVEENILLKELFLGTSYLKEMIDSGASKKYRSRTKADRETDEERIEALRQRMTAVESDLTELNLSLSVIDANVPVYRNQINDLKEVDNEFENILELLVIENDRLLDHIETESHRISEKITELKATDSAFNQEIDNYLGEVNTELGEMNEILDSVDSDKINSDIAELKAEDIVIKETIDTNYGLVKVEIDKVDGSIADVDIDEHKQAIVVLKEEDIKIANKVDSTDTEVNIELNELEAVDIIIRSELAAVKESTEGAEDNILKGSLTAAAGMVPVAKETGYIDDGWIDPEYITSRENKHENQ